MLLKFISRCIIRAAGRQRGGLPMKRIAMEQLVRWKKSSGRKPLILRGARQVGKTWLMKEFGRQYFDNVMYLNFDENRRLARVFDGNLEPRRIVRLLEAETGISADPEKTLIIFDEVQEAPEALASLKYFCEEAPQYALMAAGSLLGVALHAGTSFPVGKVSFMTLRPMNFAEFLYAVNAGKLAELLEECDFQAAELLKERCIEMLRQYYYVGGMPEAVKEFAASGNFARVRGLQKELVSYYQQDFSKHSQTALIPRLNMVWQSIPLQLAKENRKFFYGQVKEGARAKDFELAIQWLSDCGLIHKVSAASKPGLPLNAYTNPSVFKIYLHDVGLLSAMSDLSAKTLLAGNEIFSEFKGALTEQYVLQEIKAASDRQICYYSSEKSRCEIDFLVQEDDCVIPVEVKAEENLRAKSLRVYNEKYKPNLSVRTSMSGYRRDNWLLNIPLYFIGSFEKIVKNEIQR